MLTRRLACAALALGAALAASALAYDLAEVDADDTPGNALILLGWDPSRFPLPFTIDAEAPADATPGELEASVLAAFSAWTTAGQGNVSFSAIGPLALTTDEISDSLSTIEEPSCPTNADCRRLVATVTDWAAVTPVGPGTLALTVIKFIPSSRRIVDADVIINAEDHVFEVDGNALKFDLEGVLVHEFGHVLGIGHPASAIRQTSTMWPDVLAGDQTLRTLETDDANAVMYLYAPLSLPVPGPDNNTLGLLARPNGSAVGSGGGGGCTAAGAAGGGGTAGALLGVALSLALRRPRRAAPRPA